MTVEKGLFYINDKDMADYGCFLCETRADGNVNYNALLKPPKMKTYTAVSFRERDGEELPDVLPTPRYEARDIELNLAIVAATRIQWFEHYKAVLALLKSGWLVLRVPEIEKTVKAYLKAYSEFNHFTVLAHSGQQVAVFSITLREPKPTV